MLLTYVGFYDDKDDSVEDEALFVCEMQTFNNLCAGLTRSCQCQEKVLKMTSIYQVRFIDNLRNYTVDFSAKFITW